MPISQYLEKLYGELAQFIFELHVNDCVGPKQADKNSIANFQSSPAYYLVINPHTHLCTLSRPCV